MQTVGRFTSHESKSFPLDCETLEALQTNTAIVAALGRIAGCNVILSGCELEGGRRQPGYVFLLSTADYPEGEILRFEGGAGSSVYISKTTVAVSAGGTQYAEAYVERCLKAGVGAEMIGWSSILTASEVSNLALRGRISKLEADIKTLGAAETATEPVGVVKLWAGTISAIPDGYLLCDGRALKQTDYADLYAALGTAFNTAPNTAGSSYTTESGMFRLPDLRGRFVVGYSDVDTDYNSSGRAGGEKKHTLSADEMPTHTHKVRDYIHLETPKSLDTYDVIFNDLQRGSGDTDTDNTAASYYEHNTYSTGGGKGHENRPPYYALAYIIKAR